MFLSLRQSVAFTAGIAVAVVFYVTMVVAAVSTMMLAVMSAFKMVLILFDGLPVGNLGWMVLGCLASAAITAVLAVTDERATEGLYTTVNGWLHEFFVGARS